jgi:hypothetical protein
MASNAITKLANRAQRAESQNKRIKLERAQTLDRTVGGFEVLVGGAIGGLADAYLGGEAEKSVEVMGIPVVPVVGTLAAATSLAAYPGASHVGAIGAGATAYWLGRFIRDNA